MSCHKVTQAIDDIAVLLVHKNSTNMDKFPMQIETLVRNQEIIMSRLLAIDRRMQVILNSQLTLNESVTKVTNDIEILRIQRNENSITIDHINMKMKKLDKELEKSEDETPKCKEIPSKSCNVCQKKFEKFCDLETHIESEHKEAETFKCKKCDKIFYLQWRLKKHEQIHVQRPQKPCKYFVANKDCPFEKLGCKFLHQEKSDLEAIGETETDKIEGSEENSVTNEKLITLEDQLRKAKEKNESYSDIIKKAGAKTKLLEGHNKKLKEKLLEYRSALQKLTDAYETK